MVWVIPQDIINFLYLSELRKNFDNKIIYSIKKKLKESAIKKIDYMEIKNESNLLPAFNKSNSRLFIAFYIGKIRIIDNYTLY